MAPFDRNHWHGLTEIATNGQLKEIDRVYASYPELNDDAFVKENLDKWLR